MDFRSLSADGGFESSSSRVITDLSENDLLHTIHHSVSGEDLLLAASSSDFMYDRHTTTNDGLDDSDELGEMPEPIDSSTISMMIDGADGEREDEGGGAYTDDSSPLHNRVITSNLVTLGGGVNDDGGSANGSRRRRLPSGHHHRNRSGGGNGGRFFQTPPPLRHHTYRGGSGGAVSRRGPPNQGSGSGGSTMLVSHPFADAYNNRRRQIVEWISLHERTTNEDEYVSGMNNNNFSAHNLLPHGGAGGLVLPSIPIAHTTASTDSTVHHNNSSFLRPMPQYSTSSSVVTNTTAAPSPVPFYGTNQFMNDVGGGSGEYCLLYSSWDTPQPRRSLHSQRDVVVNNTSATYHGFKSRGLQLQTELDFKPTVWEENSPESLVKLVSRFIILNPTVYCSTNKRTIHTDTTSAATYSNQNPTHAHKMKNDTSCSTNDGTSSSMFPLKFKNGFNLPQELSDILVDTIFHEGFDFEDELHAWPFSSVRCTPLSGVNVRNVSSSSVISDEGLQSLIKQNLKCINIHNCPNIGRSILDCINIHSSKLTHLTIGNSVQVLPDPSHFSDTNEHAFEDEMMEIVDIHNAQEEDQPIMMKCHSPSTKAKKIPKSASNNSTNSSNPPSDIIESLTGSSTNLVNDKVVLLNTPHLTHLTIHDLFNSPLHLSVKDKNHSNKELSLKICYLKQLLLNVSQSLSYLDLSNMNLHQEMLMNNSSNSSSTSENSDGNQTKTPPLISALQSLNSNSLQTLILYNLHEISQHQSQTLAYIVKFKNLRHLDISQSSCIVDMSTSTGHYTNPNSSLNHIVSSLPKLTYLDISGTNLAGNGSFVMEIDQNVEQNVEEISTESVSDGATHSPSNNIHTYSSSIIRNDCDIPGLSVRSENPLQFLGLYKSTHDACCRPHIPALSISGSSNERQILVAGRKYLNRSVVLESVLNDLFALFRYFNNCQDIREALDVILQAMNSHPLEKVIQISGSASLYYVVRSSNERSVSTCNLQQQPDYSRDSVFLNVKMRQKILTTLLNGMSAHRGDGVMMRNGCLILCQFSIPSDILFDYERVVRILLYIMYRHTSSEAAFIQRAAIYLLNSMACQVNGHQKLLVGDLGAIERMLALIQQRVKDANCDEVLETAWSCMWNVTDETAVNCARFLDAGGMDLFLQCINKFGGATSDKTDLLKNMMGLLGNVAEVEQLRPRLMTSEFVAQFIALLDSTSDGIEVSYNAAAVLAHLASDGVDAWTISSPSRLTVLNRLVTAIQRWDVTAERNITYRSFEPILRLIRTPKLYISLEKKKIRTRNKTTKSIVVSNDVQKQQQTNDDNMSPLTSVEDDCYIDEMKYCAPVHCQLWAVWAMANLTNIDDKYCDLLERESGVSVMHCLMERCERQIGISSSSTKSTGEPSDETTSETEIWLKVLTLTQLVCSNIARYTSKLSTTQEQHSISTE